MFIQSTDNLVIEFNDIFLDEKCKITYRHVNNKSF